MKKEGIYADAQIVLPPGSDWGIARRRTVILSGTQDEINQGFEALLTLADRNKISGDISLSVGDPIELPHSQRPFRNLNTLSQPVEDAFMTTNLVRSLRSSEWLTRRYLKNIQEAEPMPEELRSGEYVDPALREMTNYPFPAYQTNAEFLFRAATFIEQSLFTSDYQIRPLINITGIGKDTAALAERYGVLSNHVLSQEVPRLSLTALRAIIAPTYLRRAMTKLLVSAYDSEDMSENDFYLGMEVVRRLATKYTELWPGRKQVLPIAEAYDDRHLISALFNMDWFSAQTVLEGFLVEDLPETKRFQTFINAAVPTRGALLEEVFNAVRYRMASPAFLVREATKLEDFDSATFKELLAKLSGDTASALPIDTYLSTLFRTLQCLAAPEDLRWQTVQYYCRTVGKVLTEDETVLFTRLVKIAVKDFMDTRV